MSDADLEVEQEEEFSLADLAELDAGQIAEVRFESLPAGIYVFRGESAQFSDGENQQEERRIILTVKHEVVECKSCMDRGVDKADLIGKKHTEKYYVVPAKAAEGLGLIRGMIADLGLPNEGPFGGVEGKEPGIVDGIVGHEFTAKIIKRPNKNNPSEPYSQLKLDPPKKR